LSCWRQLIAGKPHDPAAINSVLARRSSMIPKSGSRFSEKIMLKQKVRL
jgi:hypothetical protein